MSLVNVDSIASVFGSFERVNHLESIQSNGNQFQDPQEAKRNPCPKPNVQKDLYLRRSRHGNHLLSPKRRCPDSAGRGR